MPYISADRRADLETAGPTNGPGDLNYILSQEVREYIQTHGLSYRTLNDIIGVLAALSMEVYRRLAAPYEDAKLRHNGDVFDEVGD